MIFHLSLDHTASNKELIDKAIKKNNNNEDNINIQIQRSE